MKRIALALFLLASPALADPASDLIAQTNRALPTNGRGLITAFVMRNVLDNIITKVPTLVSGGGGGVVCDPDISTNCIKPLLNGSIDVNILTGALPTSVIVTNLPGTQPVSGTIAVSNLPATQPISATSLPLPALAATSTKQSDGSQKTQIVDGSGNVIASTSNNLNVQCSNCSGSGVSAADEASFTAGTSLFAPAGGFFQTTATSNPLTTGQQGFVQMTAQRAFFTNLRNSSGAEIGNSTTPVQVSLANTASNATAVKVDGSATVQPISGSITANLGTLNGAATAAKQPALGTAGTASADVITVQGVTSMTPLKVDGSGFIQPVSGTVTANIGTVSTLSTAALQTTGNTSLASVVTNQTAVQGATGSTVPASAVLVGANSTGNTVALIQASASAAINVSTATTTQLVALSSSKKIYVTSFDVIAADTGNITFVYGTGSNCGTGTTSLTGAYNLVAQAGIAKGNGLGPVLVVPASNALCVTTTQAIQMSGSVSYTQF